MHRCGSGFLLTLAITFFVAAFTGCLGKSSSNAGNGGVQTVALNPGGMTSMDVGRTQVFSASGRNAVGGTVLGVDIQFVVASGSQNAAAPVSIINNGAGSAVACAGTWDPTGSFCNAGTPGLAIITAVVNGVSSPPTTVYVHQHIDSLQISRLDPHGPPQYDCFSQGQTWGYQALAYNSNGLDITSTVGPMSWSFSNFGVVTAIPTTPPNQPNVLNQVVTTAKAPGITQLFATVSGTTSNPFPYTTCLIKAIYLQIGGQGQTGNSITVNNGGSVSVTATAVDTLYGIANNTPLSSPPLTWSTTNPEVAAFSSTTNSTGSNSATAGNNLGGTTLFASCGPPTCNIGVLPVLPIYASDGLLPNGTKGFATISVDVTTTSALPIYTAWAATTGCNDQSGCSSALFSVTPGTTPIGSIVSLPRTPNSMMFNHLSTARLYIGSDQGLLYVDVSANPSATPVSTAPIPCNVSLCGKVLTISNDGKMVVVSDTVSTPSQVYIYSAGSINPPVDLVVPGETATAAAFSPDQLKLFILTSTGKMYIYSTLDALTSVPIATSATDVAFSADGSFAYVAGTPASSVSAFSTCSLPDVGSLEIGKVATSRTPLKIFPSPLVEADPLGLTQDIIALEPPNIELLQAQDFTQVQMPYKTPLQLTCNPPAIQSFTNVASFDLGQGNIVPVYSQLVADGNELIIVAQNVPAVLIFNVRNGTTTSVPLAGGSVPLVVGTHQPGVSPASASTDGSQVFVAACDQFQQDGKTCAAASIHIVNTISQGDFQQVPYTNINDNSNPNMCNSKGTSAPLCLPDLIAIQPK